MKKDVSWMLELEIKPGGADGFPALMAEMVGSTRNETGTLSYEWSTSADGSRCHIWERYVDSEAAVTHLGKFGQHFAERFLEVFQPTRIVVYGSPSAALKEALAGFGPIYMQPADGFTR